MTTFILDTNHPSPLLVPSDPLWNKVDAAVQRGDRVLLPLDVVEELQFGIEATRDPGSRAVRQARLDRLVTLLPASEMTLPAALEGGSIRGRLRRAGRQLGTIDGHLAGLAKVEGYVLLTDDQDFAPLAGEIRIENWLR